MIILFAVLAARPVPDSIVTTSRTYTIYSALAYCNRQKVQNKQCTLCAKPEIKDLTDIIFDSYGSLTWYTAYSPKRNRIIAAYKGTSNIRNILEDIDVIRKQRLPEKWGHGAIVANGWHDAALNSVDMLYARMRFLMNKYPAAELEFVGHSSGGAYSFISALYLIYEYAFEQTKVHLFNVASPMIGDGNFLKLMANTKFASVNRLVNGADIVPLVPPRFMGYSPLPQELYINGDLGPNTPPVYCDESFFQKGDCNNRYKWLPLLGNLSNVRYQHFNYFDLQEDFGCDGYKSPIFNLS
jgi:hypothetical protein